jgi:hypothetical protein
MGQVRADMENLMEGEYGGDVPVLFLDAAYDPEPEPTLPDEPDPRDQVGLVEP